MPLPLNVVLAQIIEIPLHIISTIAPFPGSLFHAMTVAPCSHCAASPLEANLISNHVEVNQAHRSEGKDNGGSEAYCKNQSLMLSLGRGNTVAGLKRLRVSPLGLASPPQS